MTEQTFGSALRHPWALVTYGYPVPGRRRPTRVAYLTDDEKTHYLGGVVEFFRGKDEPRPRWHYLYKRAKRIPYSDVLYRFPITDKSKWGGPSTREIRRAKKALPVTPAEQVAA